jgi:antitoxin component HigA of HigAB toxin-antitoxin module
MVIQNDAEHTVALARITELWDNDSCDEVGTPEQIEFDALVDAICEYENAHELFARLRRIVRRLAYALGRKTELT